MVQYTLPDYPDVIINIDGKDSRKAREKAMDRLIEMVNNEELPSDLPEGLSPSEFIEIDESAQPTKETNVNKDVPPSKESSTKEPAAKEPVKDTPTKEPKESQSATGVQEDEITQAIQALSNLATLKLKMQESKNDAMKVRQLVELLFSDESIAEDQVTALKDGFKVLKTFAQTNVRYREAREQAEAARRVIDAALQDPMPSSNSSAK